MALSLDRANLERKSGREENRAKENGITRGKPVLKPSSSFKTRHSSICGLHKSIRDFLKSEEPQFQDYNVDENVGVKYIYI